MQQIASERREALRLPVTVDGRRPTQTRELPGRDCEPPSNNTSATRSSANTQCFICSRIYFDQSLQRCPHCNSESLQHYTSDDLNLFARDSAKKSFGVGAWIKDEE
jgi:hypothetical protein